MGLWITTLAFAALAVASWFETARLYAQGKRDVAECNDARAQRDRLNTRNAELAAEVGKLQAMANDPLTERLAGALRESEQELERCEQDRRKLAKALSTRRTVPIKRIDAAKPTHPQKEQEG